MGSTPFYNLFYLEPGIDTADFLNADELRFKTLDSQLYGIYQIFGNGIIEDNTNNNKSWRVSTYSDSNKYLKVSVSSGKGHVSYKSAETFSSKDVVIPVLPSDSLVVSIWFYAVENDLTPVNRDVDFIASLTRINDSVNYINVGGVNIDLVNDTIDVFEDERQVISIFESLSSIIYNHKHIGGSANPSPIDLQTETINQLSGVNVESIDLSTVTRGKLSASRLPKISHDLLEDIGSLSHSQLDSLLSQYIDYEDTYRLADLSIANRLKTLIALKKQSGLEYIDSTQLNTIVYVPGIFPNTFANSSVGKTANFSDKSLPNTIIAANIYDSDPWSSGLGISSSTSDSVYADVKTYATKRDFETAKNYNQANNVGFYENIKINGDSLDDVTGNFTISTPLNFFSIEQPINNIFSSDSGWNRAVNTTSNYSNGTVSVDTRLYSYKIFDNALSFSDVSNIGIGFSVGLGTTLSKIGQIYMYLVLGTDDDDPLFNDDVAVQFDSGQYFPTNGPQKLYLSSPDGSEIGYKIFDDSIESSSIGASIYKNISLNNLWPTQFRSSVKGLGFYWSSIKGWNPEKSINFYLNTPLDSQVNPSPYNYDALQVARKSSVSNSTASMFTWNESLFAGTGNFLFRFDSGNSNTVFNLLQWGFNLPDNTNLSIKTRTDLSSNLFYELSNIDLTTSLASGFMNPMSNKGRYLDVLFTLNSDATKVNSPTVNELKITYSTVGTGNTKVYNSRFSDFENQQTGWETEKYYSRNIGFGATYVEDNKFKNKMVIAATNTVGNWIYLRNNSAISVDLSNTESTYEDGVDTAYMSTYLSPVQIYEKSVVTGFNNPKDFQALEDGSNIYCDTLNDRVVIFNADGKITKLIQGNIRLKQEARDFVALGGYFNPTVRKIWLAFSQNISSDTSYDATKVYIVYDNNVIRLDDTRIDQNQTGLFDLINGKSATLEITFTSDSKGKALSESISNARTKYIRIDKGAFVNGEFEANNVGLGPVETTTVNRKTLNHISYFNLLNDSYAGTITTSFGLPVTAFDFVEDLDFNDDSAIPTENLLGPNNQIDNVIVEIYEGPIFFRNIYNPISVHYSNNKIIIAQPFTESIIAYNDDETLSTNFTVPYTIAPFLDNKIGSVYEISDGLLLIGCPSVNNEGGKLLKYKVIGSVVETNLVFSNFDVVKALPGPNQDNYYVLLDDILNDGENTRLKLIDSTGNVLSTWGENYEILHPKGLRLISDIDILVSE